MNRELLIFKLVLEKAKEPEIKLTTSVGSSKNQESFKKNIYFCFTMPKPMTVWIMTNWKFFKPGFNSMWTISFQIFKMDLEKAEGPEIKLPTSTGSLKEQESSRKKHLSALFIMPKPLDCVDHNKLWKILKEMGILDHLTWLLRNL